MTYDALPLSLVFAIYGVGAMAIWFAGSKAARNADEISRRTGIGGAVIGMMLLGAMNSLPEIATSTTAAISGDAQLAVGNLLGGVAFQVLILAVADAFLGRNALTSTVVTPSILMQAVVCILLLSIAVGGAVSGDFPILGVGAWSTALLVLYLVAITLVRDQDRQAGWLPQRRGLQIEDPQLPKVGADEDDHDRSGLNRALVGRTLAVAATIFVAGYLLTQSAEAIAVRTGFSTGIAGLTLVAIATSLPELSTAIGALRIGRNDIAVGAILGGNMFDTMQIFFVDVLYVGPPVLGEVGRFAAAAGILGIILTAIYLVGMLERRDRTVLKMGYDSLLVLLVYAGGVVLLFNIAEGG